MSWSKPNPILSPRDLVRKFLISERENFGVQQLPLVNLLKPEELDWQVLPFVTRRWKMIDTRVPRNLHSAVRRKKEWAYRCHLER